MADILNNKVKELLKAKESKKALATVDKQGEVHVVFKGSLTVDDAGNLIFLELLETSQTNRNLTYSIWFDKKVAVNVLGNDGTSFEIRGIPERVILTGPEFEEKYKEVRAHNPKADLSGIWIIKPTDVREETFTVRLQDEIDNYPIIGHMDRDAVK